MGNINVYATDSEGYITEIKSLKSNYELGPNEYIGIPEYETGFHYETGEKKPLIIGDNKAKKILEMSNCAEEISLNGIDFTWDEGTTEEPDIQTHHYSLSALDQNKINLLYINCANGQPLTSWHYDGGKCTTWTAEKFIAFAEQAIAFVTSNTVRFNTGLRPYINSLESVEEIEAVTFHTELPSEIETEVLEQISIALTGAI